MKAHILKFRKINEETFKAIKFGKKKIETRARTSRYSKIEKGDILKFICGKDSFEKPVHNVKRFKTITALLKEYKPSQINPKLRTKSETIDMYYSFPKYRDKIKKFGLIAFELK